jgi:hypothetical protein
MSIHSRKNSATVGGNVQVNEGGTFYNEGHVAGKISGPGVSIEQ